MKHLLTQFISLAVAGLLAACGGGSTEGDTPDAKHDVPASATASPAAYTAFAASLSPSDSATPLEMSGVDSPPTSETATPVGV